MRTSHLPHIISKQLLKESDIEIYLLSRMQTYVYNKSLFPTLLLVLLLSSCGVYGSYKRPNHIVVQDSIQGASAPQSDTTTMASIPWDKFFEDPILKGYIETALKQNTDLKVAELNVEKASASLLAAGLSFAPDLGIAPSISRDHSNLSGWSKENSYILPIAASWELDLSGRLLNRYRASKSTQQESQALWHLSRSNIIASVANTYYTLRMLDRQLVVATDSKKVMDETARTMEILLNAGRVTGAAVAQAQASATQVGITINDLNSQITTAENALRLILMQPNLEVKRDTVEFQSPLDEELKVGIPLQLLSHRPDIMAAEARLMASFYDTQAARGNFLPSLTLSASGTWLNKLGQVVVNPLAFVTELAASAMQPVLAKGQNISRLKIAKATYDQALLEYQKTLLAASHEVSNYLAEYTALAKDKELRAEEVALRKAAEEQTLMLMNLSNINYLEVLTAQSQRLNAELGGITNEFQRSQALINLWKALGGGTGLD